MANLSFTCQHFLRFESKNKEKNNNARNIFSVAKLFPTVFTDGNGSPEVFNFSSLRASVQNSWTLKFLANVK